jgi:hypothetical protein
VVEVTTALLLGALARLALPGSSAGLVGDCLDHPRQRDRVDLGEGRVGYLGGLGERCGDGVGVAVGHLQAQPAHGGADRGQAAEAAADLLSGHGRHPLNETDRDPRAEQAQISGRHALIGTDAWPDRYLMIVAVDAASGEPVVWDRASAVPLVPAVTASSAFPGASPPIQIGGRWYIDGALRSGTNTDLAIGARLLVVIEPLAHLLPRQAPRQEPEITQAGAVVSVAPDAASVSAFGPDLYDSDFWNPAYEAGLAQAATVADEIGVQWSKDETGRPN